MVKHSVRLLAINSRCSVLQNASLSEVDSERRRHLCRLYSMSFFTAKRSTAIWHMHSHIHRQTSQMKIQSSHWKVKHSVPRLCHPPPSPHPPHSQLTLLFSCFFLPLCLPSSSIPCHCFSLSFSATPLLSLPVLFTAQTQVRLWSRHHQRSILMPGNIGIDFWPLILLWCLSHWEHCLWTRAK